jgi:hypothetical protein
MKQKRFKAEQIVVILREAEIQLAKARDITEVCRMLGISEQTYSLRYRPPEPGCPMNKTLLTQCNILV